MLNNLLLANNYISQLNVSNEIIDNSIPVASVNHSSTPNTTFNTNSTTAKTSNYSPTNNYINNNNNNNNNNNAEINNSSRANLQIFESIPIIHHRSKYKSFCPEAQINSSKVKTIGSGFKVSNNLLKQLNSSDFNKTLWKTIVASKPIQTGSESLMMMRTFTKDSLAEQQKKRYELNRLKSRITYLQKQGHSSSPSEKLSDSKIDLVVGNTSETAKPVKKIPVDANEHKALISPTLNYKLLANSSLLNLKSTVNFQGNSRKINPIKKSSGLPILKRRNKLSISSDETTASDSQNNETENRSPNVPDSSSSAISSASDDPNSLNVRKISPSNKYKLLNLPGGGSFVMTADDYEKNKRMFLPEIQQQLSKRYQQNELNMKFEQLYLYEKAKNLQKTLIETNQSSSQAISKSVSFMDNSRPSDVEIDNVLRSRATPVSRCNSRGANRNPQINPSINPSSKMFKVDNKLYLEIYMPI